MRRITLDLVAIVLVISFTPFLPSAFGQAKKVPPRPGPKLVVQQGHLAHVNSLALSKDGKWLVTAGAGGDAILWETATGREVRVFKGHRDQINAVALSEDGQWLATCSGGGLLEIDEAKDTVRLVDATTRLWNVTTGEPVRSFGGHEQQVTCVALSRDGKLLASGSRDGTARVFDTASGKQLFVFRCPMKECGIQAVVFARSGKWLATADNRARIWDLATGKQIAEFKPQIKDMETVKVIEHVKIREGDTIKDVEREIECTNRYPVHHLAVSGDDKWLVAAGWHDRQVVWEIATGKLAHTVEGKADCSTLTMSQDGKLLVMGLEDKTIQTWDLANRKPVQKFEGKLGSTRGLALSQDGKWLFSTDDSDDLDNPDVCARMWEVATGRQIRVFRGMIESVNSVSLADDGKRLVTGSGTIYHHGDATAQLWDLTAGKQVRVFKGHSARVRSVALSGDGKRLVTGGDDEVARFWDVDTGNELRAIKGHSGEVTAIALSRDGKWLVAGSGDMGCWDLAEAESGFAARSFNVETGAKGRYFGPQDAGGVNALALSKDGGWLATGASAMARLWDMNTGKLVREFKGHKDSVNAVVLAADGKRLVSGSSDGTARLWDTANGNHIRTYTGHAQAVTCVALSRDGKSLATGSDDRTIRLHDLASAKLLRVFQGHSEGVACVALTADGKRLISGSLDGSTRIWDVGTGKELCRLLTLRDGTWVVLDETGRFDSNADDDIAGVHWVDGMSTSPLRQRVPGLLAKILAGG